MQKLSSLFCLLLIQTLSLGSDPAIVCLVDQSLDPGASLVLVDVTLKGEQLRFVLDSGAQAHVYDSRLIPLLTGSLSDAPDCQICDPQDLRVQGIADSVPCRGAVVDLAVLSNALSTRIDGILGMPFLVGRVLVLDYDICRVRILSKRPEENGERFQVSYDNNNLPFVCDIQLANFSSVLLIDTGSTYGICLRTDLFDRLLERNSIHELRSSTQLTLLDSKSVRTGSLCTLELGTIRLSSIPIVESEIGCVGMGSVGLGFLRNFNVTIDFTRDGNELFLQRRDVVR